MPKIDEIRDQIDKIDEKLLQLFNRRAKLAIISVRKNP
ncbi:MAG: chorismate mutase, partial [Nitrospinota bacterium]|nr:chorismate mutase [Nitrospinota bacterium]